MLETCHCTRVTHFLPFLAHFVPLSSVFQEMFAFLNKKNLRQYIYKVNDLLIYIYISHSFLYLSDDMMKEDLYKATLWPIEVYCVFVAEHHP